MAARMTGHHGLASHLATKAVFNMLGRFCKKINEPMNTQITVLYNVLKI